MSTPLICPAPDTYLVPALTGWALLAALLAGYLVTAALRHRRQRRGGMRTADALAIERQTRALQDVARYEEAERQRASCNALKGQLEERRKTIVRIARAAAVLDYRRHGRKRANPYQRHSRDFALWALEYASSWEEQAQAETPAAAQQPSGGAA